MLLIIVYKNKKERKLKIDNNEYQFCLNKLLEFYLQYQNNLNAI